MHALVLPVIHVANADQARTEVETVMHLGADGVFLINHAQRPSDLAELIGEMRDRDELPGWTGANFLGLDPDSALRLAGELRLDGLWTDNAGVHAEAGWEDQLRAQLAMRQETARDVTYFGGVAFKYQPHRVEADVEARAATDFIDVVTTSGPGTASAANESKLRAMHRAIGRERLAVASGVTPDNATMHFRYVSQVLVASGISHDWHHVDQMALRRLLAVRDRVREQ